MYGIRDRQILLTTIERSDSQQQKKIDGKVTDSSNLPIPGVTVIIEGTSLGTVTNNEGRYTLMDVPKDAILQFSFVGMKTQDIEVGNQTTINVTMEINAIGIEEVVAIGYGTVRRQDLTGSVSSVGSAILKDIPVTSAAQAIVGQMPGVQVTKTEGSPDADIKIRVRGGGSITQDNSPLYVVDGFPVEDINDIAPTDIESIDVLKDASSTAIYGARGANGVILITTKSGTIGKGKVQYNTYFGIKNIVKTLDVLSPYEYVLWQYELQGTDPIFEKYFGDFRDYNLYQQMDGTDWQNEIFGNTGTSMYHNISFSGGSDKSKYNISVTRNDEKEIMLGSGYNRTNLNISTSHKVNDWLTVDIKTRVSDSYLKGAGTSSNSRLSHAIQFRPVEGLSDFIADTDEDFEISSSFILNPLDQTIDDYRRSEKLNFDFNGAIKIDITKDLQYKLEIGKRYGHNTDKRFYGIKTSNVQKYGKQPMAYNRQSTIKSYRIANVITYQKDDFIEDHDISLMAGQELNSYQSERITSEAKYFPKYIDTESALSMMTLGTPDPLVTENYPDRNLSSFFGRVNYNYKSKYLASATFRADGSSKFAPGNQWGYFPSAALA